MFFPSFLIAFVPALLFVAVVYWVDRYEKEPLWLLSVALLWGALPSIVISIVASLLFALPFQLLGQPLLMAFAETSLIPPPVEESAKGLLLLGILLFGRKQIDSPLDGLIYGAMIGVGFGAVEHFFYFVATYAEEGLEAWRQVILLRTLFGLNHALYTSTLGLGLAVAVLSPSRLVKVAAPILGWGAAVYLHFMHNTLALLIESLGPPLLLGMFLNSWGGMLILVVIGLWSVARERRWRQEYLPQEVERGTLRQEQVNILLSRQKRFNFRMRTLIHSDWNAYRQMGNFFDLTSQLAYARHHARDVKDGPRVELVEEFRRQVAELSEVVGGSVKQ